MNRQRIRQELRDGAEKAIAAEFYQSQLHTVQRRGTGPLRLHEERLWFAISLLSFVLAMALLVPHFMPAGMR